MCALMEVDGKVGILSGKKRVGWVVVTAVLLLVVVVSRQNVCGREQSVHRRWRCCSRHIDIVQPVVLVWIRRIEIAIMAIIAAADG